VIAANADGVWNMEGASVKITVKPYFYQTWWFLTLASLAVALIVWLIYHNRVSHLHEIADTKTRFSRQLIESQEAERKRIASELHDGLGQSLAIIANRAVMGKNKRNEPENVSVEFDEISRNALAALEEVQVITSNLHPHYLERLGLTKALRAMILKVSDVVEIESEIDSIDNLFPKDAEINIYRIVQESLGNIIKHSAASEAVIKIKKTETEVVISIKDDGRGFDTENVKPSGGGLGLVGLRERTNIIGGKIFINSSVGNGTEIRVILPLKSLD
jgi:signal transduction histidine kinase